MNVISRDLRSRLDPVTLETVPDGTPGAKYNKEDPNKGHDHTFFIQLSRDVFAD